jgi:acyl carrier protein
MSQPTTTGNPPGDVRERLLKLLDNRFQPIEPITDQTQIKKDLQADDIDLQEMPKEINREFGTSISRADIEEIKTFGDLVKYIKGLVRP